jgi:hypothetical protein
MSRALIIIDSDFDRQRAAHWCRAAPVGCRVEFKQAKRTTEQSDKMWAMLTDVAKQADHHGRRYSADHWKVIFLNAIGREVQFIPALDGSSFIPWGQSSSDLSVKEMSDLIEFVTAWGTENNIAFHDAPAQRASA